MGYTCCAAGLTLHLTGITLSYWSSICMYTLCPYQDVHLWREGGLEGLDPVSMHPQH